MEDKSTQPSDNLYINIAEVNEILHHDVVNRFLNKGWLLLEITKRKDLDDGFYVTYVIGRPRHIKEEPICSPQKHDITTMSDDDVPL